MGNCRFRICLGPLLVTSDFAYSYDGKQLAIVRGHREADVVLIRDSEK